LFGVAGGLTGARIRLRVAMTLMGQTGTMSEAMEQRSLLEELLVRVAALEESYGYLEKWCEEQQDALDVIGAPAWPSEDGTPVPRLYALDLRDEVLAGGQELVELHQHAPGPGVEPAV
jgi:hypothetical protein